MASTPTSTPPQSDDTRIITYSMPERKKLRKIVMIVGAISTLLLVGLAGYWATPWLVGTPLYEYYTSEYSLKIPTGYTTSVGGTEAVGDPITRFAKRDSNGVITSGVIVVTQPFVDDGRIDLTNEASTNDDLKPIAEQGFQTALENRFAIGDITITKTSDKMYRISAKMTNQDNVPGAVDAIMVFTDTTIYLTVVMAGTDSGLARQTATILDSFKPGR